MSYSVTLVKTAEGIRLDEDSISGLAMMPDGRYTVAGHHVADGESGSEWVSVSITRPGGFGSLGASSNHVLDRRHAAPVPLAPVEGMPPFTVPQ